MRSQSAVRGPSSRAEPRTLSALRNRGAACGRVPGPSERRSASEVDRTSDLRPGVAVYSDRWRPPSGAPALRPPLSPRSSCSGSSASSSPRRSSCSSPWVLKYAIDDLNAGGHARRSSSLYAGLLLGVACVRAFFLFPDAPHHHRRVARHRIRHPQRLLRAAAADAARVLPGAAHRRPDVARDQRSERRAHDDRAGGHVLREHDARVRRRDRADGCRSTRG